MASSPQFVNPWTRGSERATPRSCSPARRNRSPTRRDDRVHESYTSTSPTIAERRHGPQPSPIDVGPTEGFDAPDTARPPRRHVQPQTPARGRVIGRAISGDETSSAYSEDDYDGEHVSPLRVVKEPEAERKKEKDPRATPQHPAGLRPVGQDTGPACQGRVSDSPHGGGGET